MDGENLRPGGGGYGMMNGCSPDARYWYAERTVSSVTTPQRRLLKQDADLRSSRAAHRCFVVG